MLNQKFFTPLIAVLFTLPAIFLVVWLKVINMGKIEKLYSIFIGLTYLHIVALLFYNLTFGIIHMAAIIITMLFCVYFIYKFRSEKEKVEQWLRILFGLLIPTIFRIYLFSIYSFL